MNGNRSPSPLSWLWDSRALSTLLLPPWIKTLTGPHASLLQRWLWQRTVPAKQEQLVQASTAQCSPEATWRP